MDRIIYCLLLLGFLAGCGGHRYFMHEAIDLVHSTQDVGSVLFECTGLNEPTDVIGHYIVIDDKKPIYVEAFSKLRVTVSVGKHTINIVSVAAHIKPDYKQGEEPARDQIYEYGKPAIVSFFMIEGGAAIVRYKSPLSKDDAGQLWVL